MAGLALSSQAVGGGSTLAPHTDSIKKRPKSPDCLLSEVTRLSESQ